jgi:hypothetical protein
MHLMSATFVLWAAAVTCFTVLMVYRAFLNQHETDQLFLGDEEGHVDFNRAEHDDIVRRVCSLCPLCKAFGGAAAIMSFAVIGVYLYQSASSMQF